MLSPIAALMFPIIFLPASCAASIKEAVKILLGQIPTTCWCGRLLRVARVCEGRLVLDRIDTRRYRGFWWAFHQFKVARVNTE
jgi:hypothetical protein